MSSACIYPRHDGFHRRSRNLVRCPAHLVVIALRVFIDDPDPRTRGKIVELIEGDLLPGLCQFSGRIRLSIEPCQGGVLLSVQRPYRTLTHVPLVTGLGSHYATVIFEVHLVFPRGDSDLARTAYRRMIAIGDAFVVPAGRISRELF